jgi:hypothetical protein
MPIRLDHVIVPSHDQVKGAELLAGLLGVAWAKEQGHFSPVFVNETLTLDFGNWEQFESHHYCFHVSDAEFDEIFGRIQAASLAYGSTPWTPDDMKVNTGQGGKNIYWRDADGHLWEVLTVSYARAESPLLSQTGS